MGVPFGSLAASLANSSLMSAFPESGRSDRQNLTEFRVRFRPQAVVKGINVARCYAAPEVRACIQCKLKKGNLSPELIDFRIPFRHDIANFCVQAWRGRVLCHSFPPISSNW